MIDGMMIVVMMIVMMTVGTALMTDATKTEGTSFLKFSLRPC